MYDNVSFDVLTSSMVFKIPEVLLMNLAEIILE